MSQSSQTSKSSYICRYRNPAVLKTSRTDRNPGQKFYSCAVGKVMVDALISSGFPPIPRCQNFKALQS
ncbi:hypothetical protein T459_12212 [Capsicum annuum]|uniref:Uncharacterized protein n=1 Tax=Capsicum annuum TaxID=4072 RepID=A0A2G2ZP50_CAPAN|nr:hypothetical protein T459_12212 [Capsicum annuum]